MTVVRLTPGEARRVALAAQGFQAARPATAGHRHLAATLDRLGLHQIDSVNVLVRAHYLPAFSRLGAYDTALLDRRAWGPKRDRRLFEYWAHECSLLPLALQPLLRWRMARADRGQAGYTGMRVFATERRAEAMALLARIRDEGPMAASDVQTGRAGWWEWSEPKRMLEWLFYAGHVTTATRRRSFERVYDLTERVIPPDILCLPDVPEADAQARLIDLSARALGIATVAELRDYFRLGPADAAAAIARLVAEGTLLPAEVPGWPPAYLHRDAKCPRRISARALLAPFDPLVWERARTERLFGFRYRIEIYTPASKRQHGYYVLPFLLGEELVGRVDLKADRAVSRLVVQAVHWEPGAPAGAREALGVELGALAGWLGLHEPSDLLALTTSSHR
ncbi:winged helix-turn-helix domain-containing protein [Methylobacterium nonmethylotrophicum]|uniref:Winged helix-turn-helix domain-containing protein n=1 Tax=Methylobacterium nonmethylotrophicum TaxID=1141884 RepID=A0A4Z0NF17_9HYPH|nr:crosslink repair DNA glycosylase YcaQ family protein [Methylobacterium nonmethylotrophicum]TGD93307.1 winged helix-turn-helix domain-containing protein [Methylobacterium nonmethylotrophicum]